MAIVKANFVKRGRGEKKRAKATIRYIQHRPGKDRERMTRTLFGADGVLDRVEAYRMIDDAQKGAKFYRIILSPDPKREDTRKDLDLWAMTAKTMETLEEQLKGKYYLPEGLQWVAVEHNDHTDKRHIHMLVLVPGKLGREDLQAVRQAATAAALSQRRERDLAVEHHRQQKQQAAPLRAFQGLSGQEWEPQAKPLTTLKTCPSCGDLQSVSRGRERRCSACGTMLSRYGQGYAEAQWG